MKSSSLVSVNIGKNWILSIIEAHIVMDSFLTYNRELSLIFVYRLSIKEKKPNPSLNILIFIGGLPVIPTMREVDFEFHC